mgnify:CR=1 FL=1
MKTLVAVGLILASIGSVNAQSSSPTLRTQTVTIDEHRFQVGVISGFTFEPVNTALDTPRLLSFHKNGDLFAGSRSGQVYRMEAPYHRASRLNIPRLAYPHAVAFRDEQIFIASTEGVYTGHSNSQSPSRIDDFRMLAELPGGRGHNSRTVKVGPDKRIYASLGVTGNCPREWLDNSFPFKDRRGGVLVLDESTKSPTWKTWASGLRNPVGFDWHPQTGVMYASNNGPDHQGFEQPPEVFARLDQGNNLGMPWFQFDGENIRRDHCRSEAPPSPASSVSQPAATFPARNAPMDVLFIPNEPSFGHLAGHALVALHGSWATQPRRDSSGSRSSRRPPEIVMVQFENGEATGVEEVVRGFQLDNGQRWVRPVGLALGPDNAIYISSDAGIEGIFRLRPEPNSN